MTHHSSVHSCPEYSSTRPSGNGQLAPFCQVQVKAVWVGTLNGWTAGVRAGYRLMIYCSVLLTGLDLGQGQFWGVIRPWEPSQQFPLARVVVTLPIWQRNMGRYFNSLFVENGCSENFAVVLEVLPRLAWHGSVWDRTFYPQSTKMGHYSHLQFIIFGLKAANVNK